MRYAPGLILLLWSVVYGATGLLVAPLFGSLLAGSLVLGIRDLGHHYNGARHHG